jgi:hypothetical protein
MKSVAIWFFFLFLTGCGMSVTSSRIVNGREISRTKTDVGYASVETTTEINDPMMERCLAELGAFPGVQEGERVLTAEDICAREVLGEFKSRSRQIQVYSDPYLYSPYRYPYRR